MRKSENPLTNPFISDNISIFSELFCKKKMGAESALRQAGVTRCSALFVFFQVYSLRRNPISPSGPSLPLRMWIRYSSPPPGFSASYRPKANNSRSCIWQSPDTSLHCPGASLPSADRRTSYTCPKASSSGN